MRFVSRFTRRVRTARRFVFENIMDLDHVCVVHRRWFGDLRIRTWRPDFVDYRLRSYFYGLEQDVRVRGGPVDGDRYWYEFLAPLARIRVDGLLEGPEGDLRQTETITYEFAWPLGPVFWALGSLFRRQKDDIFREDTALLEREWELDRAGFRRREVTARLPRVVVYGGTGFFGSLVVRDLLESTDAVIDVVSRGTGRAGLGPHGPRVHRWMSDLADPRASRDLVAGAAAVVNVAGPFQGMPLTLLEACLDLRVPYVDAADDRDYIERAHGLADRIRLAGIPVFVGCSVVPGMSSILTRACLARLPDADRLLVCISPGTRRPRGPGSFDCLLATVGRPYAAPDGTTTRTVRGWTEREAVEFPPPLGTRWVYTVVDVGDYFTVPRYFGPRAVTFKIGPELDLLNRSLTVLSSCLSPFGPALRRSIVPLLRAVIGAAALAGSTRGGMVVRATAGVAGRERQVAFGVSGAIDAHVIPAVLPSVAVGRILAGAARSAGVVDLSDWISLEDLEGELRRRGMGLSVRTGAGGTDASWRRWRHE